jgi:hypothetical protein
MIFLFVLVLEHSQHGNENSQSCVSHHSVSSLERLSAVSGAHATIISEGLVGLPKQPTGRLRDSYHFLSRFFILLFLNALNK